MNRKDIQRLQSIRGYPAVSILVPTHRNAVEGRQDPIRVKNLVTQATHRLLAECAKPDVEPLLKKLEELVAQIDYHRTLDGLALFVNRDYANLYYVPFPLKEQVVVDETFAIRDLIAMLNRTPRYWVLVLSPKGTRVYKGVRDTLLEVIGGEFPMNLEQLGWTKPLPSNFGNEKSKHRDERYRQFLRRVDTAFGQLLNAEALPAVVVGTKRALSLFDEVSTNTRMIRATLTGHYQDLPPTKLAELVWPLIRNELEMEKRKALDELAVAVSTQRYVSGIGEVWRLAHEGRGQTLLVEEDFHYPARTDATGLYLIPAENVTSSDVLDDAVDELVQTVLSKHGRVVFVDNGALQAHQRVALILRY
ncbi:MAG: hypothetical protein RMM98_05425 [Acidobacteriota bacterium]|nr:hypothetical protein [Blastocatellia bacterium]MDW8239036.1 hypothetical protein [Acidobacteriota bacterium]